MKNNKKNIKLYNMITPYILGLFSYMLLLVSLVGNFIIDSIVLMLISLIVYKKINAKFYKKTILKVWILGFAADLIGIIFMFVFAFAGAELMNVFDNGSVMREIAKGMAGVFNSFKDNVYEYIFTGAAVLISAVAIYFFNYHVTFRKCEMTKKDRVISSLAFAVFTAPYTFLMPLENFVKFQIRLS